MNANLDSYRQELLLALRLHDLPGPRIAEALAEVDSHIAETGEDPVAAFGAPHAYATHLAQALSTGRSRSGPPGRLFTWIDAVIVAVSGTGGWLLIDGLVDLTAGAGGLLGLPPIAAVAVGVLLLVATASWLVADTRRNADRVRDPRTGRDMAPPLPRWVIAVLATGPCGVLLIGYLVVAATH